MFGLNEKISNLGLSFSREDLTHLILVNTEVIDSNNTTFIYPR